MSPLMPPAKKPTKPKPKPKPTPIRIADTPDPADDRAMLLVALLDGAEAVKDAGPYQLPAVAERAVLGILRVYSETLGSSRAAVKLALRILGCD